jgi:L-lactate dehydrogenase complex protein LldG
MTAKENILNKIKSGLQKGAAPMPYPEVENEQPENIFSENELRDSLPELFASEFVKLGGKFLYCENEQELIENIVKIADEKDWNHVHCLEPYWLNKLTAAQLPYIKTGANNTEMDAAITDCKYAVARLGSLIITSDSASGRALPVYCPVHICIVHASQIVYDIADVLHDVQIEYGAHLPSMINIATGPSRTADIEKTLVVGIHGPKEVYVLYLDAIV